MALNPDWDVPEFTAAEVPTSTKMNQYGEALLALADGVEDEWSTINPDTKLMQLYANVSGSDLNITLERAGSIRVYYTGYCGATAGHTSAVGLEVKQTSPPAAATNYDNIVVAGGITNLTTSQTDGSHNLSFVYVLRNMAAGAWRIRLRAGFDSSGALGDDRFYIKNTSFSCEANV